MQPKQPEEMAKSLWQSNPIELCWETQTELSLRDKLAGILFIPGQKLTSGHATSPSANPVNP
jgi:hypothetical protein